MKPFELIPPVVSRPFRFIVLGWFANGLTTAAGLMFGFDGSPSLARSDDYIEVLFAILVMAGAAFISFSSLHWKAQTTTWKLELIGWPMLAAAWLLYVVAACSPVVLIFPVIYGVSFALASIYRLLEVMLFMKVNRGQWEDMKSKVTHA